MLIKIEHRCTRFQKQGYLGIPAKLWTLTTPYSSGSRSGSISDVCFVHDATPADCVYFRGYILLLHSCYSALNLYDYFYKKMS